MRSSRAKALANGYLPTFVTWRSLELLHLLQEVLKDLLFGWTKEQ